jgi:hypothetical protein
MKHYPMTKEQREILDHRLATIMEDLGDTANLVNACYGDKDPRAARAEEAQAAVQRLLWALERQTQLTTSGDAAGSCARDGGSGCERQTTSSKCSGSIKPSGSTI